MRFCGYRESYAHCLSVYAPQTLLNIYTDIAIADSPFRHRAEIWDTQSIDLRADPPVSTFVVPANSRLRPTRSNVISGDVVGVDTSDASNSGAFSLKHVAAERRFIANVDHLVAQTAFESEIDRHDVRIRRGGTPWPVLGYELQPDAMRAFLSGWSVAPEDRGGPATIADLLKWTPESGGFRGTRCILLVDSVLTLGADGDSLLDSLLTAGPGSNWYGRSLDAAPTGFSQRRPRGAPGDTENHDDLRILTVVGQSERSVARHYQDSVVVHARGFELQNSGTRLGAFGATLIGWLPDDSNVYKVNLESAWRMDA